MLGAIGPVNEDRTELTELAAAHTTWVARKSCGGSAHSATKVSSSAVRPTAEGAIFARAALRNWP